MVVIHFLCWILDLNCICFRVCMCMCMVQSDSTLWHHHRDLSATVTEKGMEREPQGLWIVFNLDYLLGFVPNTYPRVRSAGVWFGLRLRLFLGGPKKWREKSIHMMPLCGFVNEKSLPFAEERSLRCDSENFKGGEYRDKPCQSNLSVRPSHQKNFLCIGK